MKKQGYVAQQQGRVNNTLAERIFKATVDHVDLPNKLVYLKRPTAFTADTEGYLAGYGVVTGITITVPVSLTISGTTYTQNVQVQVRPPLAPKDEVIVIEVGGHLFVLDTVDK